LGIAINEFVTSSQQVLLPTATLVLVVGLVVYSWTIWVAMDTNQGCCTAHILRLDITTVIIMLMPVSDAKVE